MGTEFIQSDKDSDYQDLYRVHTLFGNILSFYAVTSKKEIFHNVDMDEADMNRFINKDFVSKNLSGQPGRLFTVFRCASIS